MFSNPKPALVALALALYAPLTLAAGACPADKPWAITLGGSANYECDVTGPGWTRECGKGKTICAAGIDNLATGGGAIHLFAPNADRSIPGTLIECTFTSSTANAGQMSASNCDISMVDGYNFDVHCHGDINLGYSGWSAWNAGQNNNQQCANAAQNAGVCMNPQGKQITAVEQAPPFFHLLGKKKGVYVAAHQVGVPVPFPNEASATGGKITCDVNGGMAVGKRDEVAVPEPEPSQVETRSVHRLRHARHGHLHAHARGLESVL